MKMKSTDEFIGYNHYQRIVAGSDYQEQGQVDQ